MATSHLFAEVDSPQRLHSSASALFQAAPPPARGSWGCAASTANDWALASSEGFFSTGGSRASQPWAQPRPKLKPVDHFDLMTLYDAEKYRLQEVVSHRSMQDKRAAFKALLDGQVAEQRRAKDREAVERRHALEQESQAKAVEGRRAVEAELERQRAHKEAMRSYNDGLSAMVTEQRKLRQDERKLEELSLTQLLESERASVEESRQTRLAERADRKKVALEQLAAARQRKQQARQGELESDRAILATMQLEPQARQLLPSDIIAARRAHVDHVMATLGTDVAERLAREARSSDERDDREHEEGIRKRNEDHQQRLAAQQERVREMLETRSRQLRDGHPEKGLERAADLRQVEVWKQQLAESMTEERERVAKARRMREDMDASLREQMIQTACVHPSELGVSMQQKQRELTINRRRLQQIMDEGFRPDLTSTVRWQAQTAFA